MCPGRKTQRPTSSLSSCCSTSIPFELLKVHRLPSTLQDQPSGILSPPSTSSLLQSRELETLGAFSLLSFQGHRDRFHLPKAPLPCAWISWRALHRAQALLPGNPQHSEPGRAGKFSALRQGRKVGEIRAAHQFFI